MASILVTGGAGFIGSNLCRVLLEKGHTVTAVDNFITGKSENLISLLTNSAFTFFEKDITDPDFLTLFGGKKFEYIYHLACPTGVPNLTILAEEMIRTCSIGTLQVLELAKAHGSRVLFASSAEVYGDPEVFPQTENYNGNADPIGPRSAYEEGKRFSESCVVMYARRHTVSGVIVRIFNTYGPGMSLDDTRVIPQFIKSVRDGKPFRIYGDGSQTRAHLFVDDLLRGLQIVMEKGQVGEAYNVGSETPMTIKDLAELTISMTGHTAGIDFQPHFISDHGGRKPSVLKVQALGWKQQVPLKEGLQTMIRTYLTPVATPVSETVKR